MANLVVIMRGISGSGKSTYVKNNYPKALVCSADEFYTDEVSGKFKYDADKIALVHRLCFAKFLQALAKNEPLVVVDNTNIKLWEVSPYYLTATTMDYKVIVITLDCDPQVAWERNVHQVPFERIQQYAQGFEPSLSFWPGMRLRTDQKSTT